jgi:glycosidase
MTGPRRLLAVLTGALLATSAGVVAALPATAAATSVALVGDLQEELGCPGDWQPACTATELTLQQGGTTWSGTFAVPAGSWNFKVALNDSWAENYGAGGAADGANIPFTLAGPARVTFSYDDASHQVSFAPADLAGAATGADRARAGDSLRSALTRERFYFVMADRFANGSTANDQGGLTGGRLTTGFDPTDKAFYHGGDLKGLTSKLDYIKGLGTTAIWLTPSFKNKPVQGKPGEESAGYHGYWITDFTQIDPHLGSNGDMKALIAAAHGKGMKVFFDIITNHTADVIDYTQGKYTYRSKKAYPYKKADGTPFDDRDYVNQPFPPLDPAVSFPYTPFLHPGDEHAKTPDWLNDVTMYHNRGDSTFAGESSTYGDFVGLDDLFTERPEVVEGMGDIYTKWVDFGIDGFRIDTVKHVNLEFWQKFIPDILGEAGKVGNDDFFAFGEVYDGNPKVMSEYTTAGKLQATLDFGFQQQGVDFAKGKPANVLADFFAKDDWYTDTDSNAYQLPTFLGNHDMGRVAMFLKDSSATEAEHLKRVMLADSLMYTVRGNPVTYYGDEQGFIGTGGDQLAREDMFKSQVAIYNNEQVLAGPEGSRDRFDPSHPIYQHLKALAALRAANPALADGAQVARYADDGAGVFAISRIGRTPQKEYLVAANNSTAAKTVTLDTWTTNGQFKPLFGTNTTLQPRKSGSVTVTVPALSVSVWGATSTIDRNGAAPSVEVVLPARGVTGRAEIGATVDASTFAQTTFLYRPVGTTQWHTLGTDDNAPYRVFHDVSGLPLNTLVEYRAIVEDAGGRVAADSAWTTVVEPESSTVPQNGDVPAQQPGTVAIAGTLDSELGCAADWLPDCAEAQMTFSQNDKIWKKTVQIPAGPYSYKAALDKSWTENYGWNAVRDGANIDLDTPDGAVTFYYDDGTHWVTSDENGPIITAPGTYQTELGCPTDWDPTCMRPWLQDPDGDGVYALILTLPAGNWEFKVAHGLSWNESYGDGGGPNNIQVSVPDGGAPVTFLYDSTTHQTEVSVG